MTVETNNDAGVLSDHRPLRVSVQCKQRHEQQANVQTQGKGPQRHPPVDRALMDISCIATPAWEEEGLKEKYQELLKTNLRESEKELRNMKHQRGRGTTDMNSINAIYDQLTKGIIKAAEQCLPRKKPPSLRGGLRVLSKQVWQPDKHWHTLKREKVMSWQASKGATDSDSIGTTL